MAHRRWLVLLLFAAVFAMHGPQCISADTSAAGAGHVMGFAAGTMTTASAIATTTASEHPMAPDTSAVAAVAVVDVVGLATVDEAGSGGHPTGGIMGHLWSVCLAVLSVGLAVLLAVLAVVRRRTWCPPLQRATHRWARNRVRPTAPDFFALCVLRI